MGMSNSLESGFFAPRFICQTKETSLLMKNNLIN